jgi:hypothetical protein
MHSTITAAFHATLEQDRGRDDCEPQGEADIGASVFKAARDRAAKSPWRESISR